MSDRDRLAADLHDELPINGDADAIADRLIALGWTNWFRADSELTTAYMVGFEKGKDAGRADLAARIEARLNEWPIGPALREHGWQDAVLAAIREEAEG